MSISYLIRGDYQILSGARTLVRKSIAAGILVSLGLIGTAIVGKRRFKNEARIHVDELCSDIDVPNVQKVTREEITDLPAPVTQYFEEVLTEGQPVIKVAYLRQRGTFRLGGVDAPWRSLTATQYVTTQPPGFVWDATIDVLPPFSARVIDLYKRGEGRLRARLLGCLPVASAGPTPEMNEGELVRYLAEAVWYPTALLPSQGVEWEPIDDHSARATLNHQDVTASLVFHFDNQDRISHVTTERYRQEDDSYAPWTGYFRQYEEHHGIQIPTDAEVEWNLPEGELPYWRATIEDITYRTA